MRVRNKLRRVAALVMAGAMTLGAVPIPKIGGVVDAWAAATASAPGTNAYASQSQMMNGLGTSGTIQFGKSGNGADMTWYVIGKDSGVTDASGATTNTMIFATKNILNGSVKFKNNSSTTAWTSSYGDYGDVEPANALYSNHWGASDLRNTTFASITAANGYFSEAEWDLLQKTTVTTEDYANGSNPNDSSSNTPVTYTTSDVLYAPGADSKRNNYEEIYIGSGNTSLSYQTYWESQGFFWTRSPYYGSATEVEFTNREMVKNISVKETNSVRPASNLNLSSILFASSAGAEDATSSTGAGAAITSGTGMTLRLAGTNTELGYAAYSTTSNGIYAKKGTSTSPVSLVVQGKNSGTDWYYKRLITSTEDSGTIVTAGDIAASLTSAVSGITADDIDLDKCQIWLEASADSVGTLTKAVSAVKCTDVTVVVGNGTYSCGLRTYKPTCWSADTDVADWDLISNTEGGKQTWARRIYGKAAGRTYCILYSGLDKEGYAAMEAYYVTGHVHAYNYDGAREYNTTHHWYPCTADGCPDTNHTAAGAKKTTHSYPVTSNKCADCGYIKGHEHELVKVDAKNASCTETGNIAYYKCTEESCGKVFLDQFGYSETALSKVTKAKTAHNYTSDKMESDSEKHYQTCSVCGAKDGENGTAHGWSIINGKKACETCGYVYTHEHAVTYVAAKAATCLQKGNTAYYTCTTCKDAYWNDTDKWEETSVAAHEIDALGHEWSSTWSKDANTHWHVCQREGCDDKTARDSEAPHIWSTETGRKACSVCGYEYNHEHEVACVEAKAATCTKSGNTMYYRCTQCDGAWNDKLTWVETDASKHEIQPLKHDWSETWETDDDEHWHVCRRENCDEPTARDSVGAHTYTDTKVVNKCATCGYLKGHQGAIIKVEAKEPTSTEPGNELYYKCEDHAETFSDPYGETPVDIGDVTIETLPLSNDDFDVKLPDASSSRITYDGSGLDTGVVAEPISKNKGKYDVVVSYELVEDGDGNPVIGGGYVDKPTEAGKYRVYISTENEAENVKHADHLDTGKTIIVDKAEMTSSMLQVNASELKAGDPLENLVTIADSNLTGYGEITVKLYTDETLTTEAPMTGAGCAAGEYFIGITITGGLNVKAMTAPLGLGRITIMTKRSADGGSDSEVTNARIAMDIETTSSKVYSKDAGGSWVRDEQGWRYRLSDGTYVAGTAAAGTAATGTASADAGISGVSGGAGNGTDAGAGGSGAGSTGLMIGAQSGGPSMNADGSEKGGIAWLRYGDNWYAFGSDGYMQTGWVKDPMNGKWYFCDENGGAKAGWHHDAQDRYWYYLDPGSGEMLLGWRRIDGKWYYFSAMPDQGTWYYDRTTGRWVYNAGSLAHPLGSLYVSEETPDGYHVDQNGQAID